MFTHYIKIQRNQDILVCSPRQVSRNAVREIITTGEHKPRSPLCERAGCSAGHASSATRASSAFSHCLFLSPPLSGPPGASPDCAGTPAAAGPAPAGSAPAAPPGAGSPVPAAPAGPPSPPAPAAAAHIPAATSAAPAGTAAAACVCRPVPPSAFPDSCISPVPRRGSAESPGSGWSCHSLAAVTCGALCGCPG